MVAVEWFAIPPGSNLDAYTRYAYLSWFYSFTNSGISPMHLVGHDLFYKLPSAAVKIEREKCVTLSVAVIM